MTIDKFFSTYKNLIFSAITCFVGVKIIINEESEYLLRGLFILSISFGYLLMFILTKIKNQRLKKLLNYVSNIILIFIVVFFVVTLF